MATPDGRELDREAKAHMALAVLLRKQRPPAKREEVRRILQSELSTAKIVEAIKRLDAEPLDEDEEPVAGSAPGEDAYLRREPLRPGRSPNPFRFTLPKLKSLLKAPHVRTPFFRFLFQEFPRIAQFGRVSHVFSPVFLLPVLRLEQGVPRYIAESLGAWANELLTFLAPVLLVGWKVLSKKGYNMLVALDRLCREITTLNFRLLNLKDQFLIEKLRNLEALFLVFHYQSETVEEVTKALTAVMASEPELSPKSERAELLVNRILRPDATIPSLYNVLLGLNMMKHRKSLTISELLTRDLGELFETQFYACDPDIEEKIRAMADELRTKILKLHREWSRVKRFKELVNLSGPDDPGYRDLTLLYEYDASSLRPSSFAEDRENIMDFAPSFFRRFETGCYPLLNGAVPIGSSGRAEIFAMHAFQNELDRIRLSASKIEREAVGFRSFPYTRYIAIKRDGKGGVSTELEVIGYLDEAASALVSIGKKLERVLSISAAAPATERSSAAEPLRSSQPVDSQQLHGDRSIVLPHQKRLVSGSLWFSGKSVREAVTLAAAVCLQSAHYFHEHSLVETLGSEPVLRQRMDAGMETMRRVADAETYDGLVAIVLQPGSR